MLSALRLENCCGSTAGVRQQSSGPCTTLGLKDDEVNSPMSVRGLFIRHNLWLDPRRRALPPFPLRRVNGAQLIQTQYIVRSATTQEVPANVESPSSPEGDIPNREAPDPKQTDPQALPASGTTYSERQRAHQFDTYRLVLALQSAGYSRPQAVALMKCLRTVLVNGMEFAKSHYLFRGDLENVSCYQYNGD